MRIELHEYPDPDNDGPVSVVGCWVMVAGVLLVVVATACKLLTR